jgi:hypothetical protein
MRYENFSANLLTVGAGKGIPAVGAGLSSVVSATLTPAEVAAAVVANQAGFTVPGVEATDIVLCVRDPIANATAITKVLATAANTVTIGFINPTAGALTPTTGTYTFLILKTQ